MEEASVEVEIGPLLFVYEYAPHLCNERYGTLAKMSFIFECTLKAGSRPAMPARPDPNQTAVKWVPLDELGEIVLLPNLGERVKRFYLEGVEPDMYVLEHQLDAVY